MAYPATPGGDWLESGERKRVIRGGLTGTFGRGILEPWSLTNLRGIHAVVRFPQDRDESQVVALMVQGVGRP
jgi:hypothetical protein